MLARGSLRWFVAQLVGFFRTINVSADLIGFKTRWNISKDYLLVFYLESSEEVKYQRRLISYIVSPERKRSKHVFISIGTSRARGKV